MKSYVVPSLSLESARLARAEAAKSMGNSGTLAGFPTIVLGSKRKKRKKKKGKKEKGEDLQASCAVYNMSSHIN
jgi:hypothetical protein